MWHQLSEYDSTTKGYSKSDIVNNAEVTVAPKLNPGTMKGMGCNHSFLDSLVTFLFIKDKKVTNDEAVYFLERLLIHSTQSEVQFSKVPRPTANPKPWPP